MHYKKFEVISTRTAKIIGQRNYVKFFGQLVYSLTFFTQFFLE